MSRDTTTQHTSAPRRSDHADSAASDAPGAVRTCRPQRRRALGWFSALALYAAGCQDSGPMTVPDMGPTMGMVQSSIGTRPGLGNPPLDAAIWVSSTDASKSRVMATERVLLAGRMFAYDLSGQNVQTTDMLMQPGLVDVKNGFSLGGQVLDLAAVAEAGTALIHFYSIDRNTGVMTDITGFADVFRDRTGDSAVPAGVALYRRTSDNVGFLIVSPRSGPMTDYLYQYKIEYAAGKINLSYVRKFGAFGTVPVPGSTDVKGILVDDIAGYLYYSDKAIGIRKYLADPDAPSASQELALFGQQEFLGDRNGLALYTKADGTGYLLSVDQTADKSRILFWPREGAAGSPHTHKMVSTLNLNADFIDGIEVTSAPLGSTYPSGLLVVSNRSGMNFLYYSWKDVASTLQFN